MTVYHACVAEWSLGAVLYEDELAAITECTDNSPQTAQVRGGSGATQLIASTRWTISVILVYALLFYCIGHL